MSIFKTLSMDRERSDWSEHIRDLTPVEQHGGTWIKREDKFAPLGQGGINGSKLRACIYMIKSRYESGSSVMVTGASIKSPQHSMTAAVAHHFGMDSLHVVGATKPETAIKAPQVQMASWFGARFRIIGVGYNTALQKVVHDWNDELPAQSSIMPYGISPVGDEILGFHHLGGLQVQNLPDVHTLVIPSGSCNTLASILYGLQVSKRPPSLRRIVTVAIGPDRTRWTWERLKMLGAEDGYRYHQYSPSTLRARLSEVPQQRNYLEIVHLNPHGEGFSTYQDEMRESVGEVALHPTYEGKVRRYLNQHYPEVLGDRSCLWVVGGPSTLQSMWPVVHGEFGTPPTRLPLWENPHD